MRSRVGTRPPHSSTTAHCQAAYPFLAKSGLGAPGVYVGRDAFGGAYVYDPWLLYEYGVVKDQNMIVLGDIGFGKSACVKTYVFRQRLFGRQSWVIDVKGEYGPLVAALGGTMISLVPGGEIRLNPLDQRGGREHQLSLLRSVAKAALRRELDPEEDAGLRVALDLVNQDKRGEQPVLPEIVDALLHPRAVMVEGVSAADAGAFAAANRLLALALQRLCEGDLRGMFDGPTTPGIDLGAPLVVLDLSAVQDSTAVGILMTCAVAWLQAILTQRTREAQASGESGVKMILVIEEGWRIAKHTGVVEWLQESFKLCRGLGVQNILVLHNLLDLETSGAAGSREARIVENLKDHAATKVIYRQPHEQANLTRSTFGLTETAGEIIPTLRRGESIRTVGHHVDLVQNQLSALEESFTYTDLRSTHHALKAAT
jgi:type IV secretory pathway VirB4 component